MSHEFVMVGWVVLGKVIGSVEFARSPVEVELFLGNSVSQPVIAHVESFGFFQCRPAHVGYREQ